MDGDIDKEKENEELGLPTGDRMRALYFDFLHDFRDYLAEYVRESVFEMTITEIPIRGKIMLFDGRTPGKVVLKNQGDTYCFLSTTGQGGYRLEPGETTEFYVNSQVIATTLSGSTTLGFIKS